MTNTVSIRGGAKAQVASTAPSLSRPNVYTVHLHRDGVADTLNYNFAFCQTSDDTPPADWDPGQNIDNDMTTSMFPKLALEFGSGTTHLGTTRDVNLAGSVVGRPIWFAVYEAGGGGAFSGPIYDPINLGNLID